MTPEYVLARAMSSYNLSIYVNIRKKIWASLLYALLNVWFEQPPFPLLLVSSGTSVAEIVSVPSYCLLKVFIPLMECYEAGSAAYKHLGVLRAFLSNHRLKSRLLVLNEYRRMVKKEFMLSLSANLLVLIELLRLIK